jgi:hypothetical protein
LRAQYIADQNDKKSVIILPMEKFDESIKGQEDLDILAERREEQTIIIDASKT